MTGLRFDPIAMEDLSAEQLAIVQRCMSGPRGRLGPPLKVLIHSAGVADKFERLGEYVRFNTEVSERDAEIIILLMARQYRSAYPWSVHYSKAQERGLSRSFVDAIARGERPQEMSKEDAALFDFCECLLDGRKIPPDVYATVSARFGKKGTIDLIGLMGYYFMLSMATCVNETPALDNGSPSIG